MWSPRRRKATDAPGADGKAFNSLFGEILDWMLAPLLLLWPMSVALTWLVVAYAGWELSQLGRNFLPQFDEGSVQINLTLPPGSSLDASNQVSGVIDRKLQQMQKLVKYKRTLLTTSKRIKTMRSFVLIKRSQCHHNKLVTSVL